MKENIYTVIAHNLRILRKEYGLTQQEMAALLNVCRTTYALYETGQSHPAVDTIATIAAFCNIPEIIIWEKDEAKFEQMIKKEAVLQRNVEELLEVFLLLPPVSQGKLLEKAKLLLAQSKY